MPWRSFRAVEEERAGWLAKNPLIHPYFTLCARVTQNANEQRYAERVGDVLGVFA